MVTSINNLAKLSMVVFLLCSSILVYGQLKPEEEYAFYKAKYPDESAIYLKKNQEVSYSIVNDSIVTKIKIYEELLHLGEQTASYASDKVYSSSFYEISNLNAYTLIPEKKKYETLKVTKFKESYSQDSYIFYDDSKETSFTFPGIQKGAKTVLEYEKIVKDSRMMSMFFFDTYIPVYEAKYTVNYDNGIVVNPQFFNEDKISIKTEKKELSDSRLSITYTSHNIDKIKFDNSSPSYTYMAATIYSPVVEYTKSNGEKQQIISTTEDLHSWYRTFIKDIQHKDNGVNELVNTIVSPDDSDIEKVKKIYYWVQKNIKYIAFEDGMRGLIPHPGNYVIDKRYGDCKDMASTIVSMLREADIDAQYTWIGSRKLPFRYSKTPSPIADNHMIATFTHKGNTYFLDATGQYTPMHLPTSMIQGKECLISLGEDDFEVKEVPIIDKEVSVISDSVNISLENGVVRGHGQASLTGYAKVFNTYRLIKANQKSIDDYVERLLGKGNNKFQMEAFELANVNDMSNPIGIDYSFNIPDYYRQVGDNIYINLVLDKTMTDGLIENRTVPIENEYKYINRNIAKLTIPDDFYIKNLPENIDNHDDNFGFSITYETSDNEVVVTNEFYVDYLIMEPKDFDSWNTIISEYANASRKALILSKKIN